MSFLFNLLILPLIQGSIMVQVHRNAIYHSPMPCDFIRNASWSQDATIQSCVWECQHEHDCQTATYFHHLKICSLFYETCKMDAILPSGDIRASVICNRKDHSKLSVLCSIECTGFPDPTAQCSSTATTMVGLVTTAKQEMTLLTTTNENVYGVWNTTAGGDSTPSTPGINSMGNYYPSEIPNNVFDNRTDTKYTNFGTCIYANLTPLPECGESTGFYFTSQRGPSLLLSVQFCTANDNPNRDPLTITIEGSDRSSSSLTLGSSWTLLYNGATGVNSTLGRYTCGTTQSVLNNTNWYSSYRMLVTTKRGIARGTQYSEVKLIGYR